MSGDIFHALDDATRRLLLDELTVRDGRTLFDLCTTLSMVHEVSMTRQAISQHLAVLETAGLIATVRQGRSKFHYITAEPLGEIARRWPAKPGEDPCA